MCTAPPQGARVDPLTRAQTAAERAQAVQRAASCLGRVAVSHQVAAVVKTLGEPLWAAAATLLATLAIRAVCTE
jgi:hypothetical protein